MVSLVQGAQGVQSQTHLPTSVETFNAIDAVSLLTLCPDEQKLVPTETQAKIKALGVTLAGGRPGAAPTAGG